MTIEIQDYEVGQDVEMQDPTDPYERVSKAFMDRLAKALVLAESMAQPGTFGVDFEKFYEDRGEFLDELDGGPVWQWLTEMKKVGRVPYPKYKVEMGE
jgi:hypothetical protein